MEFGGQIWGPGPPKWKFPFFSFYENSGLTIFWINVTDTEVHFDLWNLKNFKKFSRKWVSKFLGEGPSSPLWEAPFSHLTVGDFRPRDCDKNIFVRGESPPVWLPGNAKEFFSDSIFSATARAISKIFSGSCAPRWALLKSWGTCGSGVCLLYTSPSPRD